MAAPLSYNQEVTIAAGEQWESPISSQFGESCFFIKNESDIPIRIALVLKLASSSVLVSYEKDNEKQTLIASLENAHRFRFTAISEEDKALQQQLGAISQIFGKSMSGIASYKLEPIRSEIELLKDEMKLLEIS